MRQVSLLNIFMFFAFFMYASKTKAETDTNTNASTLLKLMDATYMPTLSPTSRPPTLAPSGPSYLPTIAPTYPTPGTITGFTSLVADTGVFLQILGANLNWLGSNVADYATYRFITAPSNGQRLSTSKLTPTAVNVTTIDAKYQFSLSIGRYILVCPYAVDYYSTASCTTAVLVPVPSPSASPTRSPTQPTQLPTWLPTQNPTPTSTILPTEAPISASPTTSLTQNPTLRPTMEFPPIGVDVKNNVSPASQSSTDSSVPRVAGAIIIGVTALSVAGFFYCSRKNKSGKVDLKAPLLG